MKKLLAIIGALIAGGLGIALISSTTQAAHAATHDELTLNSLSFLYFYISIMIDSALPRDILFSLTQQYSFTESIFCFNTLPFVRDRVFGRLD